MIIYTAQALCLGVLLWFLAQSSHRTDIFIGVYVCMWTVGVIVLYWYFGDAQDVFYSNDQQIQVQMVNRIAVHGVEYSVDGVIGNRYLITIPALLLTKCGINTILVLKFLQAVCFILTYRLVQQHFKNKNLRFKMWYIVLFSGPLFVFMSLLGLRDLVLAYFCLSMIMGRNTRIHIISWFVVFFLRPHLAVALIFGWLIGFAYQRARSNLHMILLPLLAVFSFVAGTYGYVIGSHFQQHTALDFNSLSHLWSQSNYVRLFANFGGLQFLLFGSEVVNISISKLLLLRLIFFETFLIPILFLWKLVAGVGLRIRSVRIFASFTFFLGLISSTDFNSSRQNIPFLALMGVTVAEHLANRRGPTSVGPHIEAIQHALAPGDSVPQL